MVCPTLPRDGELDEAGAGGRAPAGDAVATLASDALPSDELASGGAGPLRGWEKKIRRMLPEGFVQPVDFNEYAKEIRRLYEGRHKFTPLTEEAQQRMLDAMGRDTYMVAAYLPAHNCGSKDGKGAHHRTVSGSQYEVVVKYPGDPGVDVVCVREIPRTRLNKHLNAGKMKVYYK